MQLIMKKFIKNNFGFSIIEILIASTVIGLGSLVVMRSVGESSKQVKRTEIQTDIEQFIFGLDSYLGRKDVCEKNFISGNVATNKELNELSSPFPIEGSNGVVYKKNGIYQDGKVIIKAMQLIAIDGSNPALRVTLMRKNSSNDRNFYDYSRDIPMVHEFNSSNTKIETCYETTEATLDLAELACGENGENGIYNEESHTCLFRGFENNPPCPPGSIISGINLENDLTFVPICNPILKNNNGCPNTWMKSIGNNGEVTCLNLSPLIENSSTRVDSTPRQCGLDIENKKIQFKCI